MNPDHPQPPEAAGAPSGALSPMRHAAFRSMWIVWLVANVGMWMNDVTSAWLMTSLTDSAAMVALVQTALTLPVFLLGLPSGAIADMLDRRRYAMATQLWVGAVGTFTAAALLYGLMTPVLLLALSFANGIGLAMRWPVFAAIVPQLVPRAELPAALALNSIAMNASRIVGPLVAGAAIGALGIGAVFALNAGLSVAMVFVVYRWPSTRTVQRLPRERLLTAIRAGAQHVRQSLPMRRVLLRIFIFFFHSTALVSLLPVLARRFPGSDAGTFTFMLASLGVGAIAAGVLLPRLRRRLDTDQVLFWGGLLHALATCAAGLAPDVRWALPALLLSGMAWISVANGVTLAAQVALPDWVRARGMSIYMMAIMGSSALGAATWGHVAGWTDLRSALALSAASALLVLLASRRVRIGDGLDRDLSIAQDLQPPDDCQIADGARGPVLVIIEYQIEVDGAEAFLAVMEETRRARLSQGALSWALYADAAVPGRYIEQVRDASWLEHLRRYERMTVADMDLRQRRMGFHIGPEAPRISFCIAAPTRRRSTSPALGD
ncbi:MFS transporter [Pseudomonas sp. RIT-PI-AD]|uniref:MFS transporter n=1 Tax=Pseudomonas sp. RIT-PI-AD TaxID=3035294 RepID=UPI0021DB49C5|nr:MFS transporter [Pseudomonas sp. RIT-PI-AD]